MHRNHSRAVTTTCHRPRLGLVTAPLPAPRFLRDDVLRAVQHLEPLAADVDLTPAQLAVAWVLQNDNVAAAIIGASRPEQVGENARAAGVRLPDDVMAGIDKVLGDVVVRDASLTARHAPTSRPT